ncbi:MAG: RDD family protein [Oligoflexia bacterium]|nr:RDD family protein [Oligoflexia bacterium]
MAMNYITDDEIDKILGKIGEFKSEPVKPAAGHATRQKTNAYKSTLHTQKQPPAGASARDASQEAHRPRPAQPKSPSDFTFSYLLDAESQKELYTSMTASPAKSFSNSDSAGYIRRIYAFGTDMCLVSIVLMGFIYGSIIAFGSDSFVFTRLSFLERLNTFGVPDIAFWFAGLYAVLLFFYLAYFESLMGQTMGKIIMNIRIVDEADEKPGVLSLLLRVMLFFIVPLGLLGMHNRITGTRLVKSR